MNDGSVTHWFARLEHGDADAAQQLWERYFPELVRLARAKLRDLPRRGADEEDVALSVMDSFFEAAQQARFPDLADRNDLWRLLLRMTARKIVDLRRRELRQRRGGGKVISTAALDATSDLFGGPSLAEIVGDAPTPEFAAMMAEQCRLRLEQLNDPDLETMAVAKMQGFTNAEIAQQMGCSVRTVERRLHLIRRIWERE